MCHPILRSFGINDINDSWPFTIPISVLYPSFIHYLINVINGI